MKCFKNILVGCNNYYLFLNVIIAQLDPTNFEQSRSYKNRHFSRTQNLKNIFPKFSTHAVVSMATVEDPPKTGVDVFLCFSFRVCVSLRFCLCVCICFSFHLLFCFHSNEEINIRASNLTSVLFEYLRFSNSFSET